MATIIKKKIGILGAGSFGTAILQLLSENKYDVLLYTRRAETANNISSTRKILKYNLADTVTITTDLEQVATECELIFIAIPSDGFRQVIRKMAAYLNPSHLLIHCTKGFDVVLPEGETLDTVAFLDRKQVNTMAEIILQETTVRRVGCLSGPNLHGELLEGYPSATVIASAFNEVIDIGGKVLRNGRFRVHGSHDTKGVEMAGTLKNIMAIASGMLDGLGFGYNTRSLLIARGLSEMITIGNTFGASPQAFLGIAGIGDLVATCSSSLSRNYRLGYQLAQGKKMEDIVSDIKEVVEGARTIKIVKLLANKYKIPTLITSVMYDILYNNKSPQEGLKTWMEHPFTEDVNFI